MPLYIRDTGGAKRDDGSYYGDNDLWDLLFGLGMGASGGGGGYTIGVALVRSIIAEIPAYRRILTPVSQTVAGDFAVMAGGIGAPSAITPATITKFADYALAAIEAYIEDKGVSINALVPVEAGPVNALLAMYLGWKHGLKVFDCDGAGRAVPSLTNLVFGYNDYPIAPVYLAGVKSGDPGPTAAEVQPPPADAAAAEGAIRDNLGQYGNAAGLVCWGQTGGQLRNSACLIAGQFDLLRSFGSQLRAASNSTQAMIYALIRNEDLIDGFRLARLSQIKTDPRPGYDDGTLVFEEINTGRTISIRYENENMMMQVGDDETVTAPSGIAMMFAMDGRYVPLNNGDDLQNAGVIGSLAFIVTLKERCVLYSEPVVSSFVDVLRGDPFDYGGPIQPTHCLP